MHYKTKWLWRLQQETINIKKSYPDYEVLTADRKRHQPYSEEVAVIFSMLAQRKTQQQIADALGRTYWSIVAKIADRRKSTQTESSCICNLYGNYNKKLVKVGDEGWN